MDDDRKTSSERLESLDRRLSGVRKAFKEQGADRGSGGSAYSFGFRLAADLVAGVLAGFGLGWLLDWWLGTSPWMLLILTPLGMAAGVLNVVRAARSAEARRYLRNTRADDVPSVPDDDD